MLITKLLGLNILLMLLMCFFNTNAVYPVPGSYYSVLLRYNNRGKNRKGARIGPSPLRLWAYFDPPSVLGSLALGSIDNNLEMHNRKRITQGRLKKTADDDEGVLSLNNSKLKHDQTGTEETMLPSTTTETYFIRTKQRPIYSDLKKYNLRLENPDLDENQLTASCGGNEKVSLDPYNYAPDSEGRFFHKVIKTFGYPDLYEPQAKCIWNYQIGSECQMGMIVVEFLGGLVESSQCHLDSINILFNGESKLNTCGPLDGVTTALKWTKTGNQLVQIVLESKSQDNFFPSGRKWGAKISLSGYCWVYASHFLKQSLTGIKERENTTNNMEFESVNDLQNDIKTSTVKVGMTTEKQELSVQFHTEPVTDDIPTVVTVMATDNESSVTDEDTITASTIIVTTDNEVMNFKDEVKAENEFPTEETFTETTSILQEAATEATELPFISL